MSRTGAPASIERELDARILDAITAWHAGGSGLDDAAFDALALDLYAYQREANEPYRRFLASRAEPPPRSWLEVPAVPSSAFKDATLATFDVRRAELEFHTSGTTAAATGKHYLQRAALYDAALLAGFDRFMLGDGARLQYLNLIPDPRTKPHSSLGYMMAKVGARRGAGPVRFYLDDDAVDIARFAGDLSRAVATATPVCIAGTAFAFVALLDALEARDLVFAAPIGSRIMETGGFKGRSRVVERSTLYARLSERFAIPYAHIVAEYGMTELTSQYYDTPAGRASATRTKSAPPWLRAIVVDAAGHPVPPGEIGFLKHVDLANRSSVVAVQTEDRGYATSDGFVLLGREVDAPLRGCSLDAEDIAARRA